MFAEEPKFLGLGELESPCLEAAGGHRGQLCRWSVRRGEEFIQINEPIGTGEEGLAPAPGQPLTVFGGLLF